jgi:hypothetical protein
LLVAVTSPNRIVAPLTATASSSGKVGEVGADAPTHSDLTIIRLWVMF